MAALSTAMLAACVPAPPHAPAPMPTQAQAPVHTPAYRPAAPVSDWRDAPITPGTWTYGPGTSASFGGMLGLQCNPAARSVTLWRAAPAPHAQPGGTAITITITTSTGTRALAATTGGNGVAVTLPARDALLDAMAFSRGRFAVAVPGAPTLYVPSWTEISRVIEDCR